RLGIGICTAQKWVRKCGERGDSFFESLKMIANPSPGRKSLLTEEHQKVIEAFVDEDAHRTVVEVVERLQEKFLEFQVSRSAVHHFMTTKCNLLLK
ncbi:hypothetical protein BJV82DRAFT_496200, partial [Fennellomyces sp. T-0311]